MSVDGNLPHVARSFIENARTNADQRFLRLRRRGELQEYSWRDVLHDAEAYNSAFREAGLPAGSVIAIILDHSVDLYSCFLGAMMAGHIPTIMPFLTPKQNPEVYWNSHIKLFALSGIDTVVTFAENKSAILDAMSGQVRHLFVREELDRTRRVAELSHTDVALLQHSSGTTGLKKGVMLGHREILFQVETYARTIGVTKDTRIVTWLPLYHDMGLLACFLTPMIMGCEVSHLDAFEWSARPTTLLDEIVDFRGEYAWLPNFAFNHIVNSIRPGTEWDLSGVRALINCSEPCKPSTFRKFAEHPALRTLSRSALQVCYAMAENVFAVTQTDLNSMPRTIAVSQSSLREGRQIASAEGDDRLELLSCGRPISGVDVRIASDGGSTDGVIGQIEISGQSLYSGYYKRPEVTAEKFVDGWHRTGDLGFFVDGELFVTGRVDDLMIIRGKNVYAHEIEDAINRLGLTLPGRVVAFAVPNAMLGTDEAIVMCETNDNSSAPELRRALRKAVEAETGVTVGQFLFLDHGALIKTTSGKISREANRARFLEQRRD